MEAKIVKKGKTLEKMLASIKSLNGQNIKVGHFREQGKHYSGMSYPALLKFWAFGVSGIKQDVRQQFVHDYFMSRAVEKDVMYILPLQAWSKNIADPNSTGKLLAQVGRLLADRYKLRFNERKGPFMLGTITPLYETDDLQNKTRFKTSLNSSLQKG